MLCCIDCSEIRLSFGRFFRDIQCCKIVLNSRGRFYFILTVVSVYWFLIVFVAAGSTNGQFSKVLSVLFGHLSR